MNNPRLLSVFVAFAMVVAPLSISAQRTNGLIAYTQITADGPANVFIANPDGSNVNQVPLPSDDPAETFGIPIWSPDGTQLLISHTARCDNLGTVSFSLPPLTPMGRTLINLCRQIHPALLRTAWIAEHGTRVAPGSCAVSPVEFSLAFSAFAPPMAVIRCA